MPLSLSLRPLNIPTTSPRIRFGTTQPPEAPKTEQSAPASSCAPPEKTDVIDKVHKLSVAAKNFTDSMKTAFILGGVTVLTCVTSCVGYKTYQASHKVGQVVDKGTEVVKQGVEVTKQSIETIKKNGDQWLKTAGEKKEALKKSASETLDEALKGAEKTNEKLHRSYETMKAKWATPTQNTTQTTVSQAKTTSTTGSETAKPGMINRLQVWVKEHTPLKSPTTNSTETKPAPSPSASVTSQDKTPATTGTTSLKDRASNFLKRFGK